MSRMPTRDRFKAEDRPYPVEPLARALGITEPNVTNKLLLALNLAPSNRRWVNRCRRLGLTAAGADHWAARADLHPSIIWPAWDDDLVHWRLQPDEDDPPLEQVQPATPEQLARLRQRHRTAA